ncbi:hypothetical protein M501DRAFT_1020694 [Patellaria atrata CBS 101060]|uniref:BTB domain-containing protein n=1 Tax=Patellaria atrata CBS 101060 TaxID=1346257 RepID=A0A9P4S1T8_9PEZI|nr:hypothetical protein M501DRAFT_1020694 [Patellaria atrata CBS 101060]
MNSKEAYVAFKEFMSESFSSGLYSDLVVVCCEDRYNLHRFVLGGRCEYFANAFKQGFKEAESGVIKLHDDDPTAV